MTMQSIEVEKTFSQSDFDCFAELSGDTNPIHVDRAFSAATRFGRTVAHGMLLHTVFRGLIDRLCPGARQSSQSLKFSAPTYAGEAMLFSVRLEPGDSGGLTATMSCRRVTDDCVTCSGEARVEPALLRA